MSEYQITFGGLLTQLVNEQTRTLAASKRMMEEKGLNISYPTLLSYKNGRIVPSYETAREILKSFNYNLPYTELSQLLSYSREQVKDLNSDDQKYFQTSLRINPNLVEEGMTASRLETILNERAGELFSDPELSSSFNVGNRKLSAYISYLIQKDLKENFL